MSSAPSAPDPTRCRGTRERAGPESARTCRGDRGRARAPGPALPPRSSAPLGATGAGARARGPLGELHTLRPAVVRRRQVAPLQRAFLSVRFPQGDGELRLQGLAAEVEGMGRFVHIEVGEDLVYEATHAFYLGRELMKAK